MNRFIFQAKSTNGGFTKSELTDSKAHVPTANEKFIGSQPRIRLVHNWADARVRPAGPATHGFIETLFFLGERTLLSRKLT